jgi:signal transduction histidine kinase
MRISASHRSSTHRAPRRRKPATDARVVAADRLIGVVQDLSLARDLATIMDVVRVAARELTSADGASFVLREGDCCYYAEECAVGPLWKGRRFPLSTCISGWVMLHGEGVVIEDVYEDARVPADAYRPTFVKSLAMVPIRTKCPIGAIGNYWASRHRATDDELALLQALADSTSVAIENVEVYTALEDRVRERTLELEAAQRDLSAKHDALVELQRQKAALSALVVHDLKSPACTILLSASQRLHAADLPTSDRRSWSRVQCAAAHIHRTALNLLDIANSEDGGLVAKPEPIDVSALLAEAREDLCPQAERREITIEIACDVPPNALHADRNLLRRVLQNLLDNAVRHSPTRATVRVEACALESGVEIAVRDEGPGVPPALRERVFDRYRRLAREGDASSDFGLGLTFCRLAVEAHGGTIAIDDNLPRGSCFHFSIPWGS